MNWSWYRLLVVVAWTVHYSSAWVGEQMEDERDISEEAAAHYMSLLGHDLAKSFGDTAMSAWNYYVNMTDHNLNIKAQKYLDQAKFVKSKWKETTQYPWKTYQNDSLRRQFKFASTIGAPALPDEKFKRYEEITSNIEAVYGKGKFCDFHNRTKCDLSIEPELTTRMKLSHDPEELKYYWLEWHNYMGRRSFDFLKEYTQLSNEIAVLNGCANQAECWNQDFDYDNLTDFENELHELWEQVKPLYLQLHAYVRRKLREKYGEDVVSRTGPIPVHLLGDMWGQSWDNIYNFSAPFPNKPSVDVTNEMKKQNYTPLKMFKIAEDFFTSLNLSSMTKTFWEKSLFEKPKDREVLCAASSWDFYTEDGEDVRIKMCATVDMSNLLTAHHEMGHIQYFMQYQHHPFYFRNSANSGFHEAMGDVAFLSASTRKHLQSLGLLDRSSISDPEQEINSLYQRGLEKVGFLPFGLLLDLFRWDVFRGKIKPEDYNTAWWSMCEKYQGVEPPEDRGPLDLDPASKYHVIKGIPYIRYFVASIIQFQIHRALCIAANQYDPTDPDFNHLSECSIYNNTVAGNIFGHLMKQGASQPWQEVMDWLTSNRKMDGSALMQFFRPLYNWLRKENERTGEKIGWEPSKRTVATRGSASSIRSTAVLILTIVLVILNSL